MTGRAGNPQRCRGFALLRNSCCKLLLLSEFEAEGCGCFSQIMTESLMVFSFVGLRALSHIRFAVLEQSINNARQSVGRSRNRRRGTQSGFHAAVKNSQCSYA